MSKVFLPVDDTMAEDLIVSCRAEAKQLRVR